MTEVELTKAIRTRLEEALKNFRMEPDKKGAPFKSPYIVNGFLPPKRGRGNDESEFPFVIVRPSKGQSNDDSRVTVKLIIGCFSQDFDGFEYGLNVLSRIRNSFMMQPFLGKRFRFEAPLTWELYDDQPYPAWQLEVMTEWTIPTPQEIPDEGVI